MDKGKQFEKSEEMFPDSEMTKCATCGAPGMLAKNGIKNTVEFMHKVRHKPGAYTFKSEHQTKKK